MIDHKTFGRITDNLLSSVIHELDANCNPEIMKDITEAETTDEENKLWEELKPLSDSLYDIHSKLEELKMKLYEKSLGKV